MAEVQDIQKQAQHFWNKLTQFKFDLNYFQCHFSACVVASRWLHIIASVATMLATGAWMNWYEIEWVRMTCMIAILLLQGFNMVVDFLPYDNRKQELREMSNLLDPIYSDMEQDWYAIANGEVLKNEIEKKIRVYEQRRQAVQQHFLKNDTLPERKRILQKAEEETAAYFAKFWRE
ncbi:MAG: hypothetical protein J6J43_04005 [Oscillospiraceae bacterium]|nr:hypothetical protein [Oscillospiraceae bacterium]